MAVNFHEETNVLTILIFFILISLGGAVSIVGAASHMTSGHTSNPTTKRQVVRLSELQGRTSTSIWAVTRKAY